MSRILTILWNRLKSLFIRNVLTEKAYIAKLVKDIPDVLDDHIVYLECDELEAWTAAFLCPCGCTETIYLNLMDDVRPAWSVKNLRPITIYPSVNKRDGCKSHFFVRQGLIEWANL